jgi:hypothetical protein
MATGRMVVIKKSTWITIPLISTLISHFDSSSISKKRVYFSKEGIAGYKELFNLDFYFYVD